MKSQETPTTVQTATIAAIRVSLEHFGAAAPPETIVRHLRRFDLAVTAADVEAVKAREFLAQETARDGRAIAQALDTPADEAWREAESTSTPAMADAARLLSTAGNLDRAVHSLEVADTQGQQTAKDAKPRQTAMPPDDVPETKANA